MQFVPLEDEAKCALRERAGHDAVENADSDVEAAVHGVEVRRVVLSVEDRDDDAEEAAYLWHVSSLPPIVARPPNVWRQRRAKRIYERGLSSACRRPKL